MSGIRDTCIIYVEEYMCGISVLGRIPRINWVLTFQSIDSIDRLFRSPPSKKENNSNPKKNQWQYMWVLDKR